jgi:hypothetical protein
VQPPVTVAPPAQPPVAAPPPAQRPVAVAPPAPEEPVQQSPVLLTPVPIPPPPLLSRIPPARAARRAPWLVVEAGVFALRRELRFEKVAVGAALLREYSAPAIAGPSLRLEVFPAAPFVASLAGAGLFVDYAISVGLETQATSQERRPSELSRLAVGATWRTRPLSPLRIVFAPALSYRSLNLSVQPPVPGLPDAKLSGVKGSLDLELRLTDGLALLLGGGYVRWMAAQDLVQGAVAFFPGGSASAIELEGGLSLRITGPIEARLLGEYSSTRYALEADPSGIYSAQGARDTYLGARLMLRTSF